MSKQSFEPKLSGTLSPPAEGEDGLFSQSWFPVCLSTDIPAGELRGFDFLDGRIVVMRDEAGVARAFSAVCPHLGADLSVGSVENDQVRCAFHHFRFGHDGRCVATACGDPAPPRASLFAFPTRENYGVVHVFNGETPLFGLPSFGFPDDELIWRSERFDETFPVDPWVICCNTPDVQHIRVVHGIRFDHEDPGASATWTPHSMVYEFTGTHANGEPIHFEVGIFGTSVFYQAGEMNGRWFGFIAPMGLPQPQTTSGYLSIAVKKNEPGAEEFLQSVMDLEKRVVSEDADILRTIKFRPGHLTASDRTLARFLRYLKSYPRAHPSASKIR